MKNTKRILSLVLSVVLVFGALVALTACGGSHEHTFEEAWTTDATNHWHKATCEHAEEQGELGAHADADKNGACDVCNYKMSTNADKPSKPSTPAGPQVVTYTVTVKNAAGEAVEGAYVKLIAKAHENDKFGDNVPAKATDAEGKVVFEVGSDYYWSAQIETAPEGYASEVEHDDELNIDFVKIYAFGTATELEITLVDVPAAE